MKRSSCFFSLKRRERATRRITHNQENHPSITRRIKEVQEGAEPSVSPLGLPSFKTEERAQRQQQRHQWLSGQGSSHI